MGADMSRARGRRAGADAADGRGIDQVSNPLGSSLLGSAQPVSDLDELAAAVDAECELVRTPSAQKDIEAALAADPSLPSTHVHQQVGRAQRLRAQLRRLDAEIAATRAELVRSHLLHGPSQTRRECDPDCIVGGCQAEFAEEEGVLCGDCGLFLCNVCFGHTVVVNECQQGGRFDSDLRFPATELAEARFSSPGSLPCPLFPQNCACGHIPLSAIQRAMLARRNRGRAGDEEDVSSPGSSPHKIHLLARRRWAEAQANKDAAEDVDLVRTFTQKRRLSFSQNAGGLARTSSSTRAVLADKLNELQQLQAELAARPAAAAIPPAKLRHCAQCHEQFADFEGGQCLFMRHSHFLCAVCYGGYILRACSEGGAFEQEIKNAEGFIISARGHLPCPFFEGYATQQRVDGVNAAAPSDPDPDPEPEPEPEPELQSQKKVAPAMDCHCGAVPMTTIETVLLDPRNTSSEYWRERHAKTVVQSQASLSVTVQARYDGGGDLPLGWVAERDELSNQDIYLNSSTNELSFERPPPTTWSREVELLGRGFCPHNVFDTARLRVAIQENNELRQELERLEEARRQDMSPDELAIAELRMRVIDALDRGGCIRCPRCGVRAVKDDACIHMDSCDCGSHWCFLCGKENCPRGSGGCDEVSYFLERFPGWEDHRLPNTTENEAYAAQQEFLRRRQAFMVRAVMEHTDPTLWSRLRDTDPTLLNDVPTPGRNIDWDCLDQAEMPLFGANKRRAEENGGSDDSQRRRIQEHWAEVRYEAEMDRRREILQRRMQAYFVPVVAVVVAALIVGTSVMMNYFPPESPMQLLPFAAEVLPEPEPVIPVPEPLPEPEPEPRALDKGQCFPASAKHSALNSAAEKCDELSRPECTASAMCTFVVASEDVGEDDGFRPTGWAGNLLHWGPTVQLLLGAVFILLNYKKITDQPQENKAALFFKYLAWPCAAFWPVTISLEHMFRLHWVVAYLLCVPCAGLLQPAFLSYTLLDFLESRPPHSFAARFQHGESLCVFGLCACCGVCGWLVAYSVAMVDFRAGSIDDPASVPEDLVPVDDFAFVCNWACKMLPWLPRVELLLGMSAFIGAGVGWLRHLIEDGIDRDDAFEAAAFVMLSALGAISFLWPSSVTGEGIVTQHWAVAYIFAPLCTGLFGPVWMVCNLACCKEWLDIRRLSEDCAMVAAGCVALTFTGAYVPLTIHVRSLNSGWRAPELALPEAWSDTIPCQILNLQISYLVVGCLCAFGSMLLKCGGRRDFEWSEYLVGLFGGIPVLWPIFWNVFYQDSLLSMNPWLAGLTLQIIVGCCGTLWVTVWVGVFIEHVRDTGLENIIHPETLFKVAGVASLAMSASFCGSVYQLRSQVLLEDLPGPAVAVFSCTWPCTALRAVSACACGVGVLALLFGCRSLIGPDGQRCCTRHQQNIRFACLNFGHLIASAAVFAGAVLQACNGYPLKMPVEGLVTGPALLLYFAVPGWNSLCFSAGWKCLVWASPPRVRMLSRLYRAHTWVAILAFVGSLWLLYVLRESAVDPARHKMPRHVQAVLWQSVGIPYVGISVLLWCWGTERAERRLRKPWIYLRMLVWSVAALWPLLAAAVAADTSWAKFAVVCLGVSLGGFLYELTSFVFFRYQVARAAWKAAFCSAILVCSLIVVWANYAALSTR